MRSQLTANHRFHVNNILLILAFLTSLSAAQGHAATFTVNSTVDANDSNPGDGVCATAGGLCTLRAAITEANKLGGALPHTINVPAGTFILTGAPGEQNNVTGDLDISTPMTITGAGVDLTTIDGNRIDRILNIGSGGVTISDMTIINGSPGGTADGGCVSNSGGSITISNVKITGCTAHYGAGIFNNSGDSTFSDVTISNCVASTRGGGIYNASGLLTVSNVTIEGSSAPTGGGVHNQSGKGSYTNVTICGNTATTKGGGFYNETGSDIKFVNLTIANNSAPGTTNGGGLYSNSSSLAMLNTIVANNTGGNCGKSITSNGYNLDSGNSCGFNQATDRLNANANLDVLQDNGGPTRTLALKLGSAAIDAGTSTGAPGTDQRGVPRPQGGLWDIGAFELSYVPVYQPDVQLKLPSDSYVGDGVYEATASAQTKNGRVLSGATATYNLRLQNDGLITDNMLITGTGNGTGFTVQYLDENMMDRTASVAPPGTGWKFPITLSPGQTKDWTVKVTVAGNPSPVPGATSYNAFVTATSTRDSSKKDQVVAVTTSSSANITLVKSVDKTTCIPGEDVTYSTVASNGSGLSAASAVAVIDTIPANTGFKVGGATFTPGTTGQTSTITYTNTYPNGTFGYTPVSGGCGAPAGYDYCVKQVKWSLATVPAGASFTVSTIVRVK